MSERVGAVHLQGVRKLCALARERLSVSVQAVECTRRNASPMHRNPLHCAISP